MSDTKAAERSAKDRERLRRLVRPATTAVLTMELQNGTVGGLAMLRDLADRVEEMKLPDTVRNICDAARTAGIRVVHCTHETRADGAGAAVNCKIFSLSERARIERGIAPTEIGTPGAELLDGLFDPRDIVVPRLTGMTPFTSTALDQILRNLGVTTVVATGVSVNLGIFGMAMTALDLGYQVIVVRDAVAGVPAEYADSILDRSLSLISTIVTSDQLIDAMSGSAPAEQTAQ
jgi:biuret amidohydrolase